ncbi:MAG TPA: hypothetical protein VGP31_00575 [Planosporangium sp.]|nr:hypothetical protein [Planosporangium sp.]
MASEQGVPAVAGDDEERGSWHLRGVGAWIFALALLLAGLGGTVLYSRDGAEVGWARWQGVAGTVTVENCVHSSSYALCYGPFDSVDGSVHVKRLELRTVRHDRPGRPERTWLPGRTATHAWASDINPWRELLPAAPFALLAWVQTMWLGVSWRAWRRRREAALPAVAETAVTETAVAARYQERASSVAVGRDRQPGGWQDLRDRAVPPSPSTPQSRARSRPWETSGHG